RSGEVGGSCIRTGRNGAVKSGGEIKIGDGAEGRASAANDSVAGERGIERERASGLGNERTEQGVRERAGSIIGSDVDQEGLADVVVIERGDTDEIGGGLAALVDEDNTAGRRIKSGICKSGENGARGILRQVDGTATVDVVVRGGGVAAGDGEDANDDVGRWCAANGG